ncbi:helix-turn-helix transcriptional regulator [Umezawaea sp. Da 62-37]|uniref:helix-turn-helix domain-containing protein n=1 Tax=Umezawaea sp. Da 62-37 TaxID=3075927 RepID=UPI0028F745D9|nr:helix-turn-helix transcriptional regulator [Umezawaea sp. Da 62-37]WNV82611.1 helix-turn-helix transcriptional regulator [Umezawaea sp. Da 62-37]
MSSLKRPAEKQRLVTAAARELGEELRRERTRVGLSATFVSDTLEWSLAKLSKLECGWRGTDEWDVGTLLGIYGASRSVRDRILKLVRAQGDEWLVRDHTGGRPDELLCWRVHEALALRIDCYEPLAIPLFLRTDQYARGLPNGAARSCDPVELATNSDLTDFRTRVGSAGLEVSTFINEAVLRLVVVDLAVMHDQLMHLAFQCDLEDVHLRIVPLSAGIDGVLRHAGALMSLPEPSRPLACMETDAVTVFSEQDRAVEVLRRKFSSLDRLALDPAESRQVLRHWADVYDEGKLMP